MKTTVAALATPPGEGGVAIIRLSGERALQILTRVFRCRSSIKPRYAAYGHVVSRSGEVIDEAIAIYMPAPRSYTREDVAEIQCHAGRQVSRRVLERVYEEGALPAGPGEFTKRAFLNGRLDMSQAEAVMGIIKAGSDAALRSAVRQLRGGLSRRVQEIADDLIEILAHIEAACDFPDEVDGVYEARAVEEGIMRAMKAIDRSIDPRKARMIERGVNVVLAGRPNTGKSSILNALTGFERAIVSPLAGTTRDAVSAVIEAGGKLINLTDTAGQRDTGDEIEAIGVSVARRAESDADVVVVVIDASVPLTPLDEEIISRADERYIFALNKRDVYGNCPATPPEIAARPNSVMVSAVTDGGTAALIDAIVSMCADADPDADLITVKRHADLALEARRSLKLALESIQSGYPVDVSAVDIQSAIQSILSIRGQEASEATIDSIFKNFCVGK